MKEFAQSEAYKKITTAIKDTFHLELVEMNQPPDAEIPSLISSLNQKGLKLWRIKFFSPGSKVVFKISVFWNPTLGTIENFVPGSFSILSDDDKYFEFDRYLKFVHKDESEQKAFDRFKNKKEISADEYLSVCFDLYKKYYDPFIKDVIEGRSWPQKLFPSIQDDYS
jgi:hypothetical protein